MGGQRKSQSGRLRPGKIITQAIVFLLLGAIVNIAVAWGVAVFAPMRGVVSRTGMMYATDVPNWDVLVIRRGGAVLVDAVADSSTTPAGRVDPERIPRWSLTNSPPSQADARRSRSLQEIAYGWPAVTLFLRTSWPSPAEFALWIPWFSSRNEGMLPLKPIWEGFAVNTLFYAVLLWALSVGVIVLRALARRRRGRCPKCGYDLRGAPSGGGCSECGWKRQPEATA